MENYNAHMHIEKATEQTAWDQFLGMQQWRPFLQSWTMGEVYRDCGQEPVRLVAKRDNEIVGICQAILVDAKRGRHLAVHYGPVISCKLLALSYEQIWSEIIATLKKIATDHQCAFIRISPFAIPHSSFFIPHSVPSPLHLLAEHIWYLPLQEPDPWMSGMHEETKKPAYPAGRPACRTGRRKNEEELLSDMRKTTRNLIRRAEKEGVTIEASNNPLGDLSHFLALHDETRKRHGFTPYTDSFFRAQVARFAPRKECTLYLARYRGNVIASSIHMHAFGETSYHHGASSHAFQKIPASYLLQWTAICDALQRGDRVYSFWGVAPGNLTEQGFQISASKHPFAGVTLFKTGFGGQLLNLMHCQDIPIRKTYYLTRCFEQWRKWKRGF
ncbi:peptidoglycan bridge formation glycyltransferase FemA/FemB family protein [Candidatus Peribacteria bacterium]|nr:peptidoglycan bridge formation glycyltransferase FemA/FemB family protein [Candidatus Peribacteria bacterium]